MWARSWIGVASLWCFLSTTHACSLFPGQFAGPIFIPYPGSPVPQSLKTTTSDSSILLGEIFLWTPNDENGNFIPPSQHNITIDLATGGVSEGWPSGAVPTEVPMKLDDPSGGYELRVLLGGDYVAFGQMGTLPLLIELQLPPEFFVQDPENDIYFMVDGDLAILFYPGTIECRFNTSKYELCSTCPEGISCSFGENFATVVDLKERTIIRHQQFISSRGINVLSPGPSNSVRDVWPSLGIVSIGYTDSCGGTGYLAYNETGIIGEATGFDPGYLSALAIGEDKEVYIIKEQKVFEDDLIYVESFSVERISLVTGEVYETINLDTESLWGLSDVAYPSISTTPVSAAPTVAVATAPPTVTLGSDVPSDSPSDVPSDSPSASPVASEATGSPNVSPVATIVLSGSPVVSTTKAPTLGPSTTEPTVRPTAVPSVEKATGSPSAGQTNAPTEAPTADRTIFLTATPATGGVPSEIPILPTNEPTESTEPATLAPFPTVFINWVPPTPLPPSTFAPVPTFFLQWSPSPTNQPGASGSSNQPIAQPTSSGTASPTKLPSKSPSTPTLAPVTDSPILSSVAPTAPSSTSSPISPISRAPTTVTSRAPIAATTITPSRVSSKGPSATPSEDPVAVPTLAPVPTVLLVSDPPSNRSVTVTEAPVVVGNVSENLAPPPIPILTVSNFTVQSQPIEASSSVAHHHWIVAVATLFCLVVLF